MPVIQFRADYAGSMPGSASGPESAPASTFARTSSSISRCRGGAAVIDLPLDRRKRIRTRDRRPLERDAQRRRDDPRHLVQLRGLGPGDFLAQLVGADAIPPQLFDLPLRASRLPVTSPLTSREPSLGVSNGLAEITPEPAR